MTRFFLVYVSMYDVIVQIGQFDLFVFDEAILFGVCKYVRRKGIVESRHIKFDTWILKIYVWILKILYHYVVHTYIHQKESRHQRQKGQIDQFVLAFSFLLSFLS